MKLQIHIILSTLLLFSLTACKSDVSTQTATHQTKKLKSENTYTLTSFTPSPDFLDARIKDMSYKKGAFDFEIESETYSLGEQTADAPQKMCANSGKGQHIHLIIDNQPYAAKYESKFDYKVSDGDHYLLAFLSRSYHESIKTDGAHVLEKITTKDGSIISSSKVTGPMLNYSRPKGAYTGVDTKKVMLDFYLNNVKISDTGNYVDAKINGESYKITKWQPYYIENLPDGENSITLSLMDSTGKLIEAPLNPVTRKFKVQSEPIAE